MRYINQKDYPDWLYVTRVDMEGEHRERGKTTTVASSGCGLCSAVIVADRLLPESDFGLKEALELSYDVGANRQIGTDYDIYAPALAEKLGLAWEGTDDPAQMRHCLRTGGAVVALVDGDRDGYIGVYSHVGHYVAVVSEERDERIVVLDPAYWPDKYEEEGRKGLVEVKDTGMSVCDMQVLLNDTEPSSPRFYLFWRK